MSQLKKVFNKPRNPTPKAILEIFPNSQCVIENEEEFFEHAKKKLFDVYLLEKVSESLDNMRYVIFQLYKSIEKQIKALTDLKANPLGNTEDFLKYENNIIGLIAFLDKFLYRMNNITDISFPYFERIIEVTQNPQILKSLLLLGLNIFCKKRENTTGLESMCSLFSFFTPSLKLLHHFDWNQGTLLKAFNDVMDSRNSENIVPKILRELFLAIFEQGETIIKVIEDNSLLSIKDKRKFITTLSEKVLEQASLASEPNSNRRLKIIGEFDLAFSLFHEDLDGKFLAIISLIQSFQGFFMNAVYEEQIPIECSLLNLENCHTQLTTILDPSVVDIVLQKTRELAQKQSLPLESQVEEIEEITLQLLAIETNVQLYTAKRSQLNKPREDVEKLLKKLFCIDISTENVENRSRAPFIEIFQTVSSIYRQHIVSYKDESYNVFGLLSDSPKDKINILMAGLFSLVYYSIHEITEAIINENQLQENVFNEEFYITFNEIVFQIMVYIESFDWRNNYTSVFVYGRIVDTLEEVANLKAFYYMEIPLRVVKRLESDLEWAYTQDFESLFNEAPDPSFLSKLVFVYLEFILRVLYCHEEEDIETEAKKTYLTHMSTFKMIEYITEKSETRNSFENEFARKSQEEIIRFYTAFHLNSQVITSNEDEADQLVYYSFERLKQVWKIIFDYSVYENYMTIEFYDTVKIINYILDREENYPRYYKVFTAEALSTIYTKSFFNLNIDYDLPDLINDDNLFNVLLSLKGQSPTAFENLMDEISIMMQKHFETLSQEADNLHAMLQRDDSEFPKAYLITEFRAFDFFHRVICFLKMMDLYGTNGLSDAETLLIECGLQTVLKNHLPKFMTSSLYYMIGQDDNLELPIILETLSLTTAVFEATVPLYAPQIPQILTIINQELEKGSSMSRILKKKLSFLNAKYTKLEKFFVDSFRDDPKEIFKINSALFFMAYFNSRIISKLRFGASSFGLFGNQKNSDATPFVEIVPQMSKQIVHTALLLLKRSISHQKNPISMGYIVLEDLALQYWGSMSDPVKEYFKKKLEVLVDLASAYDDSKDEKENFLLQLSALLCLHDSTFGLKPEQTLDLYGSPERIVKVLKTSFEILFKFSKMASQYLTNTDTPYLSDIKVEFKESSNIFKSVKTLKNFFKLVEVASATQFNEIGRLIERVNQGFDFVKLDIAIFQKFRVTFYSQMHEFLIHYLDKIDYHFLSLKLLNVPEYSPFSQIVKGLYMCYNSFLAVAPNIHNLPALPPIGLFQQLQNNENKQEEEKPLEEPEAIRTIKESVKQDFLKFYHKFIPFLTMSCYLGPFTSNYKDNLLKSIEDCKTYLHGNEDEILKLTEDQSSMFSLKIYKNPISNKLRILSPILLLTCHFAFEGTFLSDLDRTTLSEAVNTIVKEIVELVQKVTTEDLLQESREFLEYDFLETFRDIIYSLILIVLDQLKITLWENKPLSNVDKCFGHLIIILRKWAGLSTAFLQFKHYLTSILTDRSKIFSLYAGIQSPSVFEQIAFDKGLLDMLIANLERFFYVLAELYVVNAFEPEKLLTLKLKSLVRLDKTGKRIFQNKAIKNLEFYWGNELTKIWEQNFAVEKDNSGKNDHSENVVVILEKEDMKGKVPASIEGNTVNISALTFLRYGMNESTKKVLERIMENIAANTIAHMKEMMQGQDDQKILKELEQASEIRISCLVGLLKNYPEISVIVTSYELENFEPAHGLPDLFPQYEERKPTFLSFYLKYTCYLYRFSATVLLNTLLAKNDTPIFVQYQGKPMLLSSYHRLIVTQEMLKILEETLRVPEKLLKTLYTRAVWGIWGQVFTNLLGEKDEGTSEDFKLEAISSFTMVSLRALKVYYDYNSTLKEKRYNDETMVIYTLLSRLAQEETTAKTNIQLLPNDCKLEKGLVSEEDNHPWICAIYKEQSYKDSNCTFSGQLVSQLPEVEADHFGDSNLFKSDSIRVPRIDSNYLIAAFLSPYTPRNINYDQRPWLQVTFEETEELKTTLRSLDPQLNPYSKDAQYNKIAKALYEFQTTLTKSKERAFRHWEKEDIFPTFTSHPKGPVVPARFRVIVKKAVKWHFKKNKANQDAQDLLANNEQENFSMLIKKIGLKEINKLIQMNKKRIKTLVRNQQEKALLSKLGTMFNQQINVEDMLTLATDIDNLKFYNQQNEFDKKLILLLANKDFIESLGHEEQGQSNLIRKALADEQAKKKKQELASINDLEVEENEGVPNNRNLFTKEKTKKVEEEEIQVKDKKGQTPKDQVAEQNKQDEEEDDEDVEEVSDFSDEGEEQGGEEEEEEKKENNKNKKKTDEKEEEGENEDNDEDYEDVSEFSDEEEEEKKEEEEEEKKAEDKVVEKNNQQKEKPQEITNQELFKPGLGLFGVGPVLENHEYVSSVCHTLAVSEAEDKDDDFQGEFGNQFAIEDDREEDEIYRNYSNLFLLANGLFQKNELVSFGSCVENYKRIGKLLAGANLLPLSLRSPVKTSKTLSEEWVNLILYLFFKTGKKQSLTSEVVNTFALCFDFIFVTLVESAREETIIPLLALYLAGYDLKAIKPDPKQDAGEEEVLLYLSQYVVRAPSIFFRPFNIDSFEAFIVKDSNKEWNTADNLTVIDLLLMTYFKRAFRQETKSEVYRSIGQLIAFLLHVRFSAKEDTLPNFIKELRAKNILSFHKMPAERLFEISKNPDLQMSKCENLTFVFKQLATIPSYRKGLLCICERLFAKNCEKEKEIIIGLKNKFKVILEKADQVDKPEKEYLMASLANIQVQAPQVLTMMAEIINSTKPSDSELVHIILESEALSFGLKDLALCYMEIIELISKLKEKNCLEGVTRLRGKLQTMLEVPTQYHIYLSKAKEFTQPKTLFDSSEALTYPGLVRISSDQGASSQVGIEQNTTPKNRDILGYQQVLMPWINRNREFINNVIKYTTEQKTVDLWIVRKFPWVLDFNVKEKILREALAARDKEEEKQVNNEDDPVETTVYIRRKYILEDTLKEFEDKKSEGVLYNFRVEFVKEPGVDQGGLKKEWLTLLSKEIFDPQRGLFKLSPNMRTLHPNPLSVIQPNYTTLFRLAGTLAGLVILAIKDEIPIDANFSKSFLKLITGGQLNLNDLEDIEPELVQSLTWMMNNSVKELEQPFIYELDVFGRKVVQELVENGSNVILNDNNKDLFISKMLIAKAFREVENQVNNFKQGFYEIIPEEILRIFSPGELEILISGKSEIDIDDLKKYTIYKDMSKDNPLVVWFWEIVENMDQSMLANLMFFITGSSQVPHGGFKNSPIILVKGSENTFNLPVAHTCFSELEVPHYQNKDQFYEKLLLAISEGKEGFYIA